jgi:glycosyltransferase involved in cell wall biosynthesis
MMELAEDLSAKGHDVTVVTPIPRYNVEQVDPKYHRKLFVIENANNIRVIRVRSFWIHMVGPVKRWLGQLGLAALFAACGLKAGKQDLVFAYSPPLTLGLSCYLLSRVYRIPFVFNVQDLFPQNIIDLGILRNCFLIRFFQSLERFVYRAASIITVHSNGNKQFVEALGINSDKVRVFYNWVDMSSIQYSEEKRPFFSDPELDTKFTVLFAGVLGTAQDLDVIVDAAKILATDPDILFLIVGRGVERGRIEARCKNEGVTNVVFRDFVPKEKYSHLVQSSDVGLVTLREEMKTPVVPSKIAHIMACGRPVVASLDTDGDAAVLIRESHGGFCLPPGNSIELAKSIQLLKADDCLRNELQKNGRAYALRHFDRRRVTSEYENLFHTLVSHR